MDNNQYDECNRFMLKPGDKYALDSEYFYHSLQLREVDNNMMNQINEEEQKKGPRSPTGRRGTVKKLAMKPFSHSIEIKELMNLELNNGPGYFVSGIEEESLCACIKR